MPGVSEIRSKFSRVQFFTWAPDVAISLSLVFITQIAVWELEIFPGSKVLNALFAFLSAGSLLWRRRFPLQVLAVVVASLSAQSLLAGSVESAATLLPLLFAIYSAASFGKSSGLIALLGYSGLAIFTLNDPQAKTFGDFVFTPILLTIVFILGRIVFAQRKKTALAEANANSIWENHAEVVASSITQERTRIARELHDVIAHGVSVMALQAGAAESVIDRDSEAAKKSLKIIRETGHDVVREMASLVSLLREEPPTILEPILTLESISLLVERLRRTGLQIDYKNRAISTRLSSAIELAACRIIQESLTNALKHAPLSPTKVELNQTEHDLVIDVLSENVTLTVRNEGGRGLIGMKERISFVNGVFDAGAFQGGWKVHAVIPTAS